MIRSLLKGAGVLAAGSVFSFVGYHIGGALQGRPVAAVLVAVCLVPIGGVLRWKLGKK